VLFTMTSQLCELIHPNIAQRSQVRANRRASLGAIDICPAYQSDRNFSVSPRLGFRSTLFCPLPYAGRQLLPEAGA
jgi:hypothetical protein